MAAAAKYKDFFVWCIMQLAAGDHSWMLAKQASNWFKDSHRRGTLKQKLGYCILWMENEGDSLLIWYVAKYKAVLHLMSLLDDAENRSSHQLTAASTLLEISCQVNSTLTSDDIVRNGSMLDPLGDTPLKLFEIYSDEIE